MDGARARARARVETGCGVNTVSKAETIHETMKSKIRAALSKAVATAKTGFLDGHNQPLSPQIAATATASAPAPRWEGGRWNTELEDLHSKLSHVNEGLEIALARVAYLRSIFATFHRIPPPTTVERERRTVGGCNDIDPHIEHASKSSGSSPSDGM